MWRTAQALARWSPPTPSRQTPWTRLISTVGPAAPATDTSDTPHTPESPESPSHKRDSTAHKAENEQARHTAQARHTDMRARLHAAVLAQTPQHGWTSASVHAAVASLHLSPASSALLPAGIASVAAQLEADVNAQLATALHERGLADIDGQARQPERAATAMHLRLQLLESYHPFWYQAVALRARTPALALRNRLLLTDEVTAYANYMAADVSFLLFFLFHHHLSTLLHSFGIPIALPITAR